jgi:hypothetical protein
MAVFVDVVLVVGLGDDTSRGGCAVTAHGHSGAALTVVPTSSLVNSASLISDIVALNPLVSVVSIATVATVIGLLARDQNLRSQVNIGPLSVTQNLDSVGQGSSGSLSPA